MIGNLHLADQPGLHVITALSPMACCCKSLFTGAGVAPYSPLSKDFTSFVIVEYLEPDNTFITDCVPTICDVGVTRGIKPRSSLTLGIS
jgi:hypothetical protein